LRSGKAHCEKQRFSKVIAKENLNTENHTQLKA
jgi:hypothetical protein